jgi:hypothetical protein
MTSTRRATKPRPAGRERLGASQAKIPRSSGVINTRAPARSSIGPKVPCLPRKVCYSRAEQKQAGAFAHRAIGNAARPNCPRSGTCGRLPGARNITIGRSLASGCLVPRPLKSARFAVRRCGRGPGRRICRWAWITGRSAGALARPITAGPVTGRSALLPAARAVSQLPVGESPDWRLAADAAGSGHHGEHAVRAGSASAAVSAPRRHHLGGRDLDQVRQALGYDKINIYGPSYGVTLGLAYLQRTAATSAPRYWTAARC